MSYEEATRAALLSLMDVVQEIAWKVGDENRALVVQQTFEAHRRSLLDPDATGEKIPWPVREGVH